MNDESPVALVTAASKGMGAACARELAGRGYGVALLARSESVETLSRELAAASPCAATSRAPRISTASST